jgi:hypothetical protein
MRRRLGPWWIVISIFVLLLALGDTPYTKRVDFLLWPLRFAFLGGLSILMVWSRWRHRHDTPAEGDRATPDWVDRFLDS